MISMHEGSKVYLPMFIYLDSDLYLVPYIVQTQNRRFDLLLRTFHPSSKNTVPSALSKLSYFIFYDCYYVITVPGNLQLYLK